MAVFSHSVDMARRGQDLDRLRALAGARGGVVSRADLADCGFSTGAVRRRLAQGVWQRIGGAVVLSPPLGSPPALNDLGLSWALRFTFGPHARVSGTLALRQARWHVPTEVHMVVLEEKPHAHMPGVTVIRRTGNGRRPRADTLRFESPRDALLDCLTVLPPAAARDLVDAVLQKRYVRPEVLAGDLSARLGRGRRNAAALRRLVERVRSGARSEAEQRMAVLLRRSRTGDWAPNFPVRDATGRVRAEIDFARVGLRIAIEVDGRAFHSDRHAFEGDRERQNVLSIGGWLILRFTWEQITQQPAKVIAVVRAAVEQRAASRHTQPPTLGAL